MTPEEAQALDPGTTDGPWEAYDPGDGTARMYAGEGEEAKLLLHNIDSDPHTACVYFTREDGELIAAAPDMRATIAALEWEWAVQVETSPGHWLTTGSPWQLSREGAEAEMNNPNVVPSRWKARLVRRSVGPVEVVETPSIPREDHN